MAPTRKRAVAALPTIALYGVLQAALYSSLLPLWQGFDEPYHFGYAQHLAVHGEIPVLDRTGVSVEVMEAMRLAPELGRFPDRLTFQEFFALSPAERRERRERLYSIPARLRAETGVPFNHEAQQPPLAYLPLALIEHIARAAPLYQRVWLMRMFTALASLALLLFGVERLGIRMALPPAWRAAAMFLLCSTQSVYAASAHACSDWLSVPMIALLFLTADYFYTRRDTRSTLLFAAVLATGLLAKAYFLVFVPFAVALVLFARARQVVPFLGLLAILAGPWYIRNWALYHSVTGLQTAVRVVPLRAVLDTAHSIRWPTTLAGLARGTLWTAIFLSFSWVTLSIMLVLLAVGFTFRLLVTRKQPPVFTEIATVAGSFIFLIAPIYAIALFATLQPTPYPPSCPWYTVGLLPGLYLLAFLGFSLGDRIGLWTARAVIALSVYIMAATWFAKLIPVYTGYESHARPAALFDLYGHRLSELSARLSDSALTGGALLLPWALAMTIATAVLGVAVGRGLGQSGGVRQPRGEPGPQTGCERG